MFLAAESEAERSSHHSRILRLHSAKTLRSAQDACGAWTVTKFPFISISQRRAVEQPAGQRGQRQHQHDRHTLGERQCQRASVIITPCQSVTVVLEKRPGDPQRVRPITPRVMPSVNRWTSGCVSTRRCSATMTNASSVGRVIAISASPAPSPAIGEVAQADRPQAVGDGDDLPDGDRDEEIGLGSPASAMRPVQKRQVAQARPSKAETLSETARNREPG